MIHKIIEPNFVRESATVFATPSLDFASRDCGGQLRFSGMWTTSGAILAFADLVSSQRFLNCTPSAFDRSKFCLNHV